MTTIAQERAALARVSGRPSLRRREQWRSSYNYTNPRTVHEPATRIFIHITVTNPNSYNSNDAHARAIEAIGRSRFPATGISYNRGCMHDGSLYEFQPIGRRGAHTVNDFRRSTCTLSGCPGRGSSLTAPSWNLNYNSRAYVICQNTGHSVTSTMIDNLARAIVADYRAGFITLSAARNPHGHRCVSAKSCPGNRMWAKMLELETKIRHYLANGLIEEERDWFDMATEADLKRILDTSLKNLVPGMIDDRLDITDFKIAAIPRPPKIPNYSDELENLRQQNEELLQQNEQLQNSLNLLMSVYFLSWEDLGSTPWEDLLAWETFTKNPKVSVSIPDIEPEVIKSSAKEGAQEALSAANLEVSWAGE